MTMLLSIALCREATPREGSSHITALVEKDQCLDDAIGRGDLERSAKIFALRKHDLEISRSIDVPICIAAVLVHAHSRRAMSQQRVKDRQSASGKDDRLSTMNAFVFALVFE